MQKQERCGIVFECYWRRSAWRNTGNFTGGTTLIALAGSPPSSMIYDLERNLTMDSVVRNKETELTTDEAILLRHDENGVATLTLNRPKQFNALSQAMLSALQTELDAIAADSSIRVVVLAANGRAFCAGHDLKEMRSHTEYEFQRALFDQCSRMMLTINRLPQPVIAKVQGLATAAGCQLVAACDLAVAADTATFATSGIRVGLFCSTPAVPVSRVMPRKKALELLLTGDFIDAASAVQFGLINHAVPAEHLDSAVQQLVEAITNKSAYAITSGKRMFYKQIEMSMEEAYDYAAEIMACDMGSADAAEGIDAFLQKRSPVWRGQ